MTGARGLSSITGATGAADNSRTAETGSSSGGATGSSATGAAEGITGGSMATGTNKPRSPKGPIVTGHSSRVKSSTINSKTTREEDIKIAEAPAPKVDDEVDITGITGSTGSTGASTGIAGREPKGPVVTGHSNHATGNDASTKLKN